jgi:hypothetical protein
MIERNTAHVGVVIPFRLTLTSRTSTSSPRADITPKIRQRSLTLSTAERFALLNPGRGSSRFPVELIAREIADHGGNVWAAVVHFGLSYEHACRIRRGWRGARHAPARPIVYEHSRHRIKYREAMLGPVS